MTRNIWLYADLHLQHGNIIKYCGRPFANSDEMDEAIIERHNAVVRDGDVVYNLGDVYFGSKQTVRAKLARMRGRKRLIYGNHDDIKDGVLTNCFSKIVACRMFPEFGLILTHIPIHPDGLGERMPVNVHGHIHERRIMRVLREPVLGLDTGRDVIDERYKNVAVEHTNYAPVNIEELRVK